MATIQSEQEEMPEEESAPSTTLVALVRLAFPTAALLLVVLYVENTFGRISTSNLYYPYFVIAMLVFLVGTVYVDEIKYLYNYSGDEGFVESVKQSYLEWQRSIGFVIAGGAYLSVINVFGFFISSFLGMIVIMLIGGLRDPKIIIASTLATLILVYVLFITIMGLNPPQGILI